MASNKLKDSSITSYTKADGITYKHHVTAVWCTAFKFPLLKDEVADAVKHSFYETANNYAEYPFTSSDERAGKVTVIDLDIAENYVLITLDIDPRYAPHKIIKALKMNSAVIVKAIYPEYRKKIPSVWTKNYLLCTPGTHTKSAVLQYINEEPTRYGPNKKIPSKRLTGSEANQTKPNDEIAQKEEPQG